MAKLDQKLEIALLKEKLEKITGKKIILKEDTFLNKTQEERREKNLKDIEDDISINEPHGKHRIEAHQKLRDLIKRFNRDSERLEVAKKPFLEQINIIEKQLSVIEGDIPERLQQQEQEIIDLMTELDITTKKVGNVVVKLETTLGRKSVKYKEIVIGIEAFTSFLEQYEKAYKDLVEKNTSFGEIRRSLILKKESYILKEGVFARVFNLIRNIFFSIKKSFKEAILSGNKAIDKLERIL